MPPRASYQSRPQTVVPTGPRKQPSCEGPIVETGSADEDGSPPGVSDRTNRRRRIVCVSSGRIQLSRLRDVNQMVGDSALIFCRHLVGTDVKPPVDRR